MIIDDEPLIRRGLESMIPWEDLGCRLVGQATNGEEGLIKIREEIPDIVFTDIKMPKMGGLDMIREALKEPDPPVFIILSGYNDFELVRQAMRLGAIDYLMKLDLEEQELTRVITEASALIQKKHGVADDLPLPPEDFKKNFIEELLRIQPDNETLKKQLPQSFALKDGCFYQIIYLKLSGLPGDNWKQSSLSQNFLINICKEQLPKGADVYEYRMNDDSFALYMESQGLLSKVSLTLWCEAVTAGIKRYLNQEIILGISAPHRNILHLPNAFSEAAQSMAFHISGVHASLHFYTDFLNADYLQEQLAHLKTEPDYFESLDNLLLQIQKFVTQQHDSEEAKELCFQLINQIYELDFESRDFFIRWFGKEYTGPRDFDKIGGDSHLSAYLLRLGQGLNSYSQQYIGEIYRYKVRKAREYIYDNRFQKISLNEVAALLEITPSYLSRIFKKVTQLSFSDYIAQVKMDEAKKLLLQNNNRIYEVSNMLGYDDPYYFSKVFKRVTQMTPSEYIGRN